MGNLLRNGDAQAACQQYRTLLAVAEAIISHRDLQALFHDLAGRLRQVVRFDYLILVLHDPANNTMRRHIMETSEPWRVEGLGAIPVEEAPAGWVGQTQQPLTLPRQSTETAWPRLVQLP